MSANDATTAANKAVATFNASLSTLVAAIASKNRQDTNVIKLKDHMAIAMRESPSLVVEKVGPHIIKYSDVIEHRRIKMLLDNDFSDDVRHAYEESSGGTVDADSLDYGLDMIQICRKTWHQFTDAEKNVIWKHLTTLLVQYATYLMACKKTSTASIK